MYHLIVRSMLRRAFAAINRGHYSAVVAQFSPHHRHLMYGRHGRTVRHRPAGGVLPADGALRTH